MAILHTWRCMAHGTFQSFNPVCPSGCEGDVMITKVLGSSVSVGRGKAVGELIDRKMEDVARQFGVGDLDVRAGKSSVPSDYRWNEDEEVRRNRINGQTYSAPVDEMQDVVAQAGVLPQIDNPLTQMTPYLKESFQKSIHIEKNMVDNSPIPGAKI